MSWAIVSILIAGLLPVICTGIAKRGFPHYDNHNPRDWLAGQTGARKRASAAEANSLEAFPFFAAGMVVALVAKAPVDTVSWLGWAFVFARVIYIYCYVADRAALRSLVWAVGYGITIALYVMAALYA